MNNNQYCTQARSIAQRNLFTTVSFKQK